MLNLDIFHEIVSQVQSLPTKERQKILSRLASTCHELNRAIRPILFCNVRWPHTNFSKDDNSIALHFLPKVLWPYIW